MASLYIAICIKHPINNQKRLGRKLVEQYQLRIDLLDESCEFYCDNKIMFINIETTE